MHQLLFPQTNAEILQLAYCQAMTQNAFFSSCVKKCKKSPSKFIVHDPFSSPFMHEKSWFLSSYIWVLELGAGAPCGRTSRALIGDAI